MALIKHETSGQMSREQAAERLREIADQLSRHNEVSFVSHGKKVTVDVPDQVSLEVEIEVGKSSEIEIEISW